MLKDNLILLRNLNKLSQEEVANKIGISRQAYAKWENGSTTPDIEKCSKIAKLYNTTIDSLLNTKSIDGIDKVIPAPKGKNIWGAVTINDRGQIVIPKIVRDKFNLSNGTRLVLLSDDAEGLALVPTKIFEHRIKQISILAAKNTE